MFRGLGLRRNDWRVGFTVCGLIGCAMVLWPRMAVSQQPQAVDADLVARAQKAREVAHTYAERLRAGLAMALKERGPVGAIGACNTLAPDLNASVSEQSTFEISRTALRVRNPENTPDAWELPNLESFQKSMAAGADPRSLEAYEVVTTAEGQRLFRYMRPISAAEPCLVCHGTNVAPEVKAEIAKYYSDDKAIGFSLGEFRGAFSLVQPLD